MEKIKTERLMPQGLNRLVLRSDDIKKYKVISCFLKFLVKKKLILPHISKQMEIAGWGI